MWVQSLGQENPLKEEMATRFSICAWKIPWEEEPGGLQFHRATKSRMRLSKYSIYCYDKILALSPMLYDMSPCSLFSSFFDSPTANFQMLC